MRKHVHAWNKVLWLQTKQKAIAIYAKNINSANNPLYPLFFSESPSFTIDQHVKLVCGMKAAESKRRW